MNSPEEASRGTGAGIVPSSPRLSLAGPSRLPIDPARALAIFVAETANAATAAAGELRLAAETLAPDLGEALGLR